MSKIIPIWTEENHNYFDLENILLNYSSRPEEKYRCGASEALVFAKDYIATFYLTKKGVEEIARKGERFFSNKLAVSNFLKDISRSCMALKKASGDFFEAKLSRMNNQELDAISVRLVNALTKVFTAYSMTTPMYFTRLEKVLKNWLKKKKIKNSTEVMSLLTAPEHKFIYSKKTDLLFKTFTENIKAEDAKIRRSMLKISPYTIETSPLMKKKKELIKDLIPPASIKHIIKVLSILSEKRLKMRYAWMLGLFAHELLLVELKRRYKVTKAQLRLYDNHELKALIKYGRIVSGENLERRKDGYLKVIKNGIIKTYIGDDAVRYIERHQEEVKKEEERSFSGKPANYGFAKGPAVVFSYKKPEDHLQKMSQMKGGEIVIAEMTRPNIVNACSKAAAIVTDEGGILCHAAVIAREFGVPCVVGTKVATSIIKDGDLVEVNADEGNIRILSKRN